MLKRLGYVTGWTGDIISALIVYAIVYNYGAGRTDFLAILYLILIFSFLVSHAIRYVLSGDFGWKLLTTVILRGINATRHRITKDRQANHVPIFGQDAWPFIWFCFIVAVVLWRFGDRIDTLFDNLNHFLRKA